MNKPSHPSVLSLAGVSLTYASGDGENIEALRSITLDVKSREFLAMIGASGCGKTTLLKVMCGLIPVSQGDVLFMGQKLTGPPKKIGMAFQDPLLLPWRTVIENVLLPIEILGLERKPFLRKAEELLETVGIGGFEDKPSWQLSGGMRQRISLCRALINDPEVLYLDEPFGALDAFTREDLWMVIQELHIRHQCTTLLVTHQLDEAVFLSDRVIVLGPRPGHIVHEEIIPFPRPRSLNRSLAVEYVEIRNRLRDRIVR